MTGRIVLKGASVWDGTGKDATCCRVATTSP
jgi:hypothetical protein